MTSFLLFVLALIYEGLSIFFLSQIDFIARNYFSNFGTSSDFDWILTYEPIIWTAYVLMIISFVVLIIPAVKALGIIRRESVDKSD